MQKWRDEGENSLWLFTPAEYNRVPINTELESIHGRKYIVGEGRIDMDVRFGHLAYGIRRPLTHEHKDIFLLMILAQ